MNKNTEIIREKNTFIRQDMRNRSIITEYQFKDLDGKEYNIYISCRKNAFIEKVTKSGRKYKILLPADVTNQILEELKSNKDKVLEKEGGIR